jgi:predicted Zn-dependent peptidase
LKSFEYEPVFKKTILDNGVRVITEHHPYCRGVSAGITLDLGTRDESEDMSGAAHFVEHMVFKGTETRDAYEIVKSLEAVGGEMNAYTTREQTCFHSTSLKEHLPLALDVLTDLMSNATFDVGDVKKEREVIIQEIKMSSDQTDDYIYDVFFSHVFKGNPLNRSILGTPKTLASMSRGKIFDFYNRRYHGQNMIVSVAGHVEHDSVVDLISRTLSLRRKPFQAPVRKRPQFSNFARAVNRPGEQVHVLMATPSCSVKDPLRFASYIVNAALGGGMTSRLYQKVREQAGLSYSVFSHLQPFADGGLMMLYAGTSGQHLKKVMSIIMKEMERLYKKGLSASELNFFKRQVIGGYILESDDLENRMNSLAFSEMTFGENRTVDYVIQEIENVTPEQIQAYVKRYFDLNKLGLLVMGDCNEDRVTRELKKYI